MFTPEPWQGYATGRRQPEDPADLDWMPFAFGLLAIDLSSSDEVA